MYLDRKNNGTANAESTLQFKTITAYVRRIVNIYSAAEMDRDYWLTKRELDFYEAMCFHVLHNILSPISEDAIQIYKKHFNPRVNKSDIANYVSRICKKKWASYDVHKKELTLNPIVAGISIREDRFDFRIRLLLENEGEID